MKKLWELYRTFFITGLFTFGGGYAMLPVIQRMVVEEKHWATDEEIADYYAIGQCTPGIIAINTSTFVGEKVGGTVGGIVATLGFVSPSFIIVTLIAMLLQNFAQYEAVQHAFEGIRICVCVLVLQAVIKLARSGVKDIFAALIFAAVLMLSLLSGVQPFVLVLVSGLLGIVYRSVRTSFEMRNIDNDDIKDQNDQNDLKGGGDI